MSHYLLGYDLGSSFVKASLIDTVTGRLCASATAPEAEMEIFSLRHGWAEQDPEIWWKNTVSATRLLLAKAAINPQSILGIGISYQMHGLVIVDRELKPLRRSIIWCDSRAVPIGDQAFHQLGELYCMGRLLNSPGNFTASKLKWVKENEPDIYSRIYKVMLPGDYLAMRLTGEIATTVSGLSEGVMWDYDKQTLSERLFNFFNIDPALIADPVSTFSVQGKITSKAAAETGLHTGTPITYRAGDQPNNAFSLNTLNPGEVATTAGTSGVIYGVVDKPTADSLSRVNTFIHVNHTQAEPRMGVMLCVNGTGIMNRWLQNNIAHRGKSLSYSEMNALAQQAPVGSDDLTVLPFGNGAERVLQNQTIGSSFHGLDFNRHTTAHLCRAVQEGIVFSLGYGFEILNQLGIRASVIRAGHANMFLSDVFCEIFAQITGAELQLYNTDGAQGAARGAGVGAGVYDSPRDAFVNLTCINHYEPKAFLRDAYQQPYQKWKDTLTTYTSKSS
jgi:xylulokinase